MRWRYREANGKEVFHNGSNQVCRLAKEPRVPAVAESKAQKIDREVPECNTAIWSHWKGVCYSQLFDSFLLLTQMYSAKSTVPFQVLIFCIRNHLHANFHKIFFLLFCIELSWKMIGGFTLFDSAFLIDKFIHLIGMSAKCIFLIDKLLLFVIYLISFFYPMWASVCDLWN